MARSADAFSPAFSSEPFWTAKACDRGLGNSRCQLAIWPETFVKTTSKKNIFLLLSPDFRESLPPEIWKHVFSGWRGEKGLDKIETAIGGVCQALLRKGAGCSGKDCLDSLR
jgi:hypothetical protein